MCCCPGLGRQDRREGYGKSASVGRTDSRRLSGGNLEIGSEKLVEGVLYNVRRLRLLFKVFDADDDRSQSPYWLDVYTDCPS